MARRTPSLLDRPAEEALRHLALTRLDNAERAGAKLGGKDPEALHDFRVALRRLRTLLRAYRELKPVRKKWDHRLRDLAHTTNGARDLEVAVENLRALRKEHDPLASHLAQRLAARNALAQEEILHHVGEAWPAMAKGLREELQRPYAPADSFAAVTARLVEKEARRLERKLHALRKAWRDDNAHDARIAGKRLRYLLEPLSELPAAAPAVEALKRFQEGFGEYHDACVLLNLIAEEGAAEAALSTHARILGEPHHPMEPEPYIALAASVQARRKEHVAALRMTYTESETPTLSAVAVALAALQARMS